MQPDLDFSEEKLHSMAQTVQAVISKYPVGYQYHGNELHDDVARLFPKARTMYTDTIQRAMRRYCHHQYKTIDQNKSLYERV